MTVSTESIRRGLRGVEKRLKFTLSDGLVEWLRQIHAEERPRPPWLWPADEWQDLPAYLERIGREWRPGARGIVVGHDGAEAWLVVCDEERRLADRAIRVPAQELAPRVERNVAPEPSPRAFYLEIGFIDFVEAPRHADWPSEVEIDALEVFAPPSLDALGTDDDDCIVFPVFNDNVNKAGYAGVGAVMASLAADGSPAFDCELCFEGGSVGQLVPYLREAILVGGGIGETGIEEVSDRLLRELTADLLPF